MSFFIKLYKELTSWVNFCNVGTPSGLIYPLLNGGQHIRCARGLSIPTVTYIQHISDHIWIGTIPLSLKQPINRSMNWDMYPGPPKYQAYDISMCHRATQISPPPNLISVDHKICSIWISLYPKSGKLLALNWFPT